jgi:hypothetical protein
MSRINTNMDSSDNIYYNIRLLNNTGEDVIPATFSENRVVPILENPSEYELAVVRFKVPSETIPIFRWIDDKFSITLSFGGSDFTESLPWIPKALPTDNKFLYGKAIWSYQSFLDTINLAFKTAFDNLKTAFPAAPPTEAPFITFNPETQLMTIWTEQLYDESTNTIAIMFNYDLFAVLPSFQVDRLNIPPPSTGAFFDIKFQRLTVKNNYNNTTTYNGKNYFKFQQEYSTLPLLNDFVSISFESDSIPIEPELLPAQTNIVRRIITDFEPLDGVNDNQALQYYPQGALRYYDLKSSYPMSRIDIRVFWIDRAGDQFPIYINRDEVLTLKLIFRKKIVKQLSTALRIDDDTII